MDVIDKLILDLTMEEEYLLDELGYIKKHMPGLVFHIENKILEINKRIKVLQKIKIYKGVSHDSIG
jgi:hypothetical protein